MAVFTPAKSAMLPIKPIPPAARRTFCNGNWRVNMIIVASAVKTTRTPQEMFVADG